MISIIICSINEILFEQFARNVRDSVGLEHEIIRIDNTTTKYSLTKAYNIGANIAKYPYLCFVHEDVLFRTNEWGKNLVSFFSKNEKAGVVGVAGSSVKTLVPSIWANGLYDTDHYNLIQYYPNVEKSAHQKSNVGLGIDYVEVQTLDGVLLFTTNDIWKKNIFDERFDGFHCYDLDFCIQVGRTFKIYVAHTVLLEHFSVGSLNKDWINNSIQLSKKWGKILPLGKVPKHHLKAIEWNNKKVLFFRMNILKVPLLKILYHFFSWGYFKNFSILNHLKFIRELYILKYKKVKVGE